jgi:hypothetical protein
VWVRVTSAAAELEFFPYPVSWRAFRNRGGGADHRARLVIFNHEVRTRM